MKFRSVYRGYVTETIEYVRFTGFVEYYEDARAIGLSNKKSMEYAWDCCMEEMNKRKTLRSLMVVDI